MAQYSQLAFADYDELIDYIDDENVDEVREMFVQFGLTIDTLLFDSPLYNSSGDELFTYLDYIIANSLIKLINYCIDETFIVLDDKFFHRCVQIGALDVYEHVRELYPTFYPAEQTFCEAIKQCNSSIAAELLGINPQLIYYIDDSVLEYLFSFDIDEETLETVRVLFNYNVNPVLFNRYLSYLHHPEGNYFKIDEDDKDLVIELIDILETNCVVASQL